MITLLPLILRKERARRRIAQLYENLIKCGVKLACGDGKLKESWCSSVSEISWTLYTADDNFARAIKRQTLLGLLMHATNATAYITRCVVSFRRPLSTQWLEQTTHHNFLHIFVSFICLVNVNIHCTLKSTRKKYSGAARGREKLKPPHSHLSLSEKRFLCGCLNGQFAFEFNRVIRLDSFERIRREFEFLVPGPKSRVGSDLP